MSVEDEDIAPAREPDTQMQDDSRPATDAGPTGRKRPRLDLTALAGGAERKRGKSMFGVLVNTLNKAKAEDKERSASEAAKKRQLIEQKLQNKLKKETDTVRRAEEAKKDRINATRKEEDLQLRDSVFKLRRTRFPQLSNFLSTSDVIPDPDAEPESAPVFTLDSLHPSRSRPASLFYLPAKLLPNQEAFLAKRKAQAKEAAEQEWDRFRSERTAGLEEITELRKKVADGASDQRQMVMDTDGQEDPEGTPKRQGRGDDDLKHQNDDGDVEMGEAAPAKPKGDELSAEKREGNGTSATPATGTGGDDDDAVEY